MDDDDDDDRARRSIDRSIDMGACASRRDDVDVVDVDVDAPDDVDVVVVDVEAEVKKEPMESVTVDAAAAAAAGVGEPSPPWWAEANAQDGSSDEEDSLDDASVFDSDDDEADAEEVSASRAEMFDPLDVTRRADEDAQRRDREAKRKKRRRRLIGARKWSDLNEHLRAALKSPNALVRAKAKKMLKEGMNDEAEIAFQRLMQMPSAAKHAIINDGRITARDEPRACVEVSRAFGEAIRNEDFDWASRDEISSLFADSVEYMNIRGEYFNGKSKVLGSLNESVRRLSSRMRSASAKGNGTMLKSFMKWTSEGPKYEGCGRKRGESQWIIDYSFKMLLMTVRIREYYVIDDETDLIVHLARCRMS